MLAVPADPAAAIAVAPLLPASNFAAGTVAVAGCATLLAGGVPSADDKAIEDGAGSAAAF